MKKFFEGRGWRPPSPSVIQQMGERELKNELRNRGLDTSGSKAQLAARLASLSSPGEALARARGMP